MTLDLNVLFPVPPEPTSPLVPTRWPGVSASSSATLVECIKDDFEKHHVFINEKNFHNHSIHHLFALWALGADSPIIRAAYAHNVQELRPRFDSPGPIDESNWTEHLGDNKYYSSYLTFFSHAVLSLGVSTALETYVLSDSANHGKNEPLMLVRFVSSIFHPMIHTGHGLEFGLPGMVAEGLAWTAVHQKTNAAIFPPSVFGTSKSQESTGLVSNLMKTLSLGRSSGAAAQDQVTSAEKDQESGSKEDRFIPQANGVHAFTILAKALKDPLLASPSSTRGDLDHMLPAYLSSLSGEEKDKAAERQKRVLELCEEWSAALSLARPGSVEERVEEIAWMNALFYGVGGASHDEAKKDVFFADFFLMHSVTSSLFLPSILAVLSQASQERLLRAYFSVSFSYYIARGRPELNFKEFFKGEEKLRVPGVHPVPSKSALHPTDETSAIENERGEEEGNGKEGQVHSRNAWHAVLQSTIYHPEAHVSKTERALAHWAGLYGRRPVGYWAKLGEGEDGLEGVEKINGSLFVRAGMRTLGRVGWVREGQEAVNWD